MTSPPTLDAREAKPRGYPWRGALLTACGVFAVLFLRRPEVFREPQFWAEDGSIFFVQADVLGWSAMTRSYGGYHHLFPRVISALASGLDPRWVPAVYFWASIAGMTAVILALFSPRLVVPHRALLAFAVVLVPHSGEAFQSLTNAQWVLALGLILLLVARDPERPYHWFVDLGAAMFIGLTGIYSVIFAPVFIVRAALRRTRAAVALAGVVALAAGIQLVAFVHAGLPASTSSDPVSGLLRLMALRTWGSLLLPSARAEAMSTVALVIGAIVVTAVLAYYGWRERKLRITRAMRWGGILMTLAAIGWKFRADSLVLMGIANGDRYFFLPKVLLVWLLISEWDGPARWFMRGLLLAVLYSSLTAFRFVPYVDFNWPQWAARIRAGEEVAVPINPPGSGFVYPGRRK